MPRSHSSHSDGYLVLCAYAIALLDLVSAVLFAVVSGMLYAKNNHWTSLTALIFTILWIIIIVVLVLGIYKRHLSLIRCWLAFTCLGILLDGIVLIYGLTLAITVNWEGVKITVLPFVGLAVEMTFVYIIYLLYLEMTGSRGSQSEQPETKVGADVAGERPRPNVGTDVAGQRPRPRPRGGADVADEQSAARNLRQLREQEELEYKRQKRLAKERRQRDKTILKNLEKKMRRGLV